MLNPCLEQRAGRLLIGENLLRDCANKLKNNSFFDAILRTKRT